MNLSTQLQRILDNPQPVDLWTLQGDLRSCGAEPESVSRALRVSGDFYLYLCDLQSKVTSRQHSQWAAALATASVTSVSLHELAHEKGNLFKQLLMTGTPALLEIGSALQSVQAWEVESALVHNEAAWKLYEELWDISSSLLPELAAAERRRYVDALLAPAVTEQTPPAVKAVLLVRLFQVVLALRLAPLLSDEG